VQKGFYMGTGYSCIDSMQKDICNSRTRKSFLVLSKSIIAHGCFIMSVNDPKTAQGYLSMHQKTEKIKWYR